MLKAPLHGRRVLHLMYAHVPGPVAPKDGSGLVLLVLMHMCRGGQCTHQCENQANRVYSGLSMGASRLGFEIRGHMCSHNTWTAEPQGWVSGVFDVFNI